MSRLILVVCVLLFSSPARADGCMPVELVRVVDGDTIVVNINGWPPIIGFNIGVRVAGCDTPELRDKRPGIREKAFQAKRFVSSLLAEAKVVELRNIRRGKYFRLVADVYADGRNISSILINSGLAHPYDGGTRSSW